MSGYLLSVMGTVLVCSLLTAIAPEGKTSSVIKGIARLACVLTIIAPVLRFFQTGSIGENAEGNFQENVIQTDESFIQYYSKERVQEAEVALQNDLKGRYDTDCDVRLEWLLEEENFGGHYTAEHIRITAIYVNVLENVNEEVKLDMSAYLTQNYCSEVLIE